MTSIANSKPLYAAQVAFRADLRALMSEAADRAGAILTRSADSSGKIGRRDETAVKRAVGDVVEGLFVGSDGRSAFASDGVTAIAPYPQLLNRYLAQVVRAAVVAQRDWLRRNIPQDVFDWLASGRGAGTMGERGGLRAQPEGGLTREQIDFEEALRRALFFPNPLAQYQPAHEWVDENGYRLSDRIWRASQRTRDKIDAMLTDGIRTGRGAFELARDLEAFLLPGRLGRRTTRPYGRDASYDAMRLARSEIAQAHAAATLASARMNPYVEGIDVARSAAGDPTCPICPRHATIDIGGARLRAPYPVASAPGGIFHPHCMCVRRPVVTRRPAQVTAYLREAQAEAQQQGIVPAANPAAYDALLQVLLGPLTALLRNA